MSHFFTWKHCNLWPTEHTRVIQWDAHVVSVRGAARTLGIRSWWCQNLFNVSRTLSIELSKVSNYLSSSLERQFIGWACVVCCRWTVAVVIGECAHVDVQISQHSVLQGRTIGLSQPAYTLDWQHIVKALVASLSAYTAVSQLMSSACSYETLSYTNLNITCAYYSEFFFLRCGWTYAPRPPQPLGLLAWSVCPSHRCDDLCV